MIADADRALTSHLLGRAVLQAAARLLNEVGVLLMPLKGIWLQQFVYRDPSARAITDVDVLVPEAQHTLACTTLRERGWTLCSRNVSEASLLAPGLVLPLDLHARLYTRGAFKTRTSDLFARGTADESAFGTRVVLPDALDVLAHAIGHALKSGNAWSESGHELQDIPLLAARFALDPRRAAEHLRQLGLARAARFVLPLTAAYDQDRFGSSLLSALPSDPLGEKIARAADALRTHIVARSLQSTLSTATGFALDSSLWRGICALGLRAWDKRLDVQVLPRA